MLGLSIVIIVVVVVIVIGRFYVALFSALEQTHCARAPGQPATNYASTDTALHALSEFRSCVKVEVAVLGCPS